MHAIKRRMHQGAQAHDTLYCITKGKLKSITARDTGNCSQLATFESRLDSKKRNIYSNAGTLRTNLNIS